MMHSNGPRRRLLFRAFAGLACAAMLVAGAFAADWPQWRGPDRDAISKETGLLDRVARAAARRWSGRRRASARATPPSSVAGGRIYTMGEDKQSSYVHALDAHDGQDVWSAKVGSVGGGVGLPGPARTPTVDGDRVYALGQFGDLVCVAAADGKEIWRKNLEKRLQGQDDERLGLLRVAARRRRQGRLHARRVRTARSSRSTR